MISWLSRIVKFLPLLAAFTAFGLPSDSLPAIGINQNHTPAGLLRDGVLSVHLAIAKGEWHPEAKDGIALSVYAFGEEGKTLQNPGPLIRVPQGTEVRASLHNTLSVPLTVGGLADPASPATVVTVAPGKTEEVTFRAITPGLSFYWGATEVKEMKLRYGIDAELNGALVVDPPGASRDEEIFLLEMISEHAGPGSLKNLATINGKSWPYTQPLQYQVGQPVHWRWIDATNEPHALHLHGFYYRIDAFNRNGKLQSYEGDARPLVVTQRIAQGETFDMSWSPDRPGRWLFHCHMLIHMTPLEVADRSLVSNEGSLHADVDHGHDSGGMGQMVLGITVPPQSGVAIKPTWHADRKLQLVIEERTGLPRYALHVRDPEQDGTPPAQAGLIGPPIVLTRGQPVEIEVVNKLKQPTAIHWHGIELESYYDGVPGWTGNAGHITPTIQPGASFVARMTPPRAGTFIYHTHWHDPSQLTNGLYGPLIVLPAGEKFDSASDLPFVFSIGAFDALHEIFLINGTPQSKSLNLQAGKKYRFRLINISTNNQGIQVSLRDHTGPVQWRVIAKDGADLPSTLIKPNKAELSITVGETYDVEFSSPIQQDLQLDVLLPAQKIHVEQTLIFQPAVQETVEQ